MGDITKYTHTILIHIHIHIYPPWFLGYIPYVEILNPYSFTNGGYNQQTNDNYAATHQTDCLVDGQTGQVLALHN